MLVAELLSIHEPTATAITDSLDHLDEPVGTVVPFRAQLLQQVLAAQVEIAEDEVRLRDRGKRPLKRKRNCKGKGYGSSEKMKLQIRAAENEKVRPERERSRR